MAAIGLALAGSGLAAEEESKAREQTPSPFANVMNADYNSDGKVSHPEFVKFHVILFKAHDENNDGKVSLDEFKKPRPTMFKEMDRDADGAVVFEEFATHWIGEPARKAAASAKPAAPGKGSMLEKIDSSGDRALALEERIVFSKHMFMKADKNNDGKLAEEEFIVFGEILFEETDADKDKHLSGDEWHAHRSAAAAAKKE